MEEQRIDTVDSLNRFGQELPEIKFVQVSVTSYGYGWSRSAGTRKRQKIFLMQVLHLF